MTRCLFASDLHGDAARYAKLLRAIEEERPAAVLLGGDLLPSWLAAAHAAPSQQDFLESVVASGLRRARERLGPAYPRIFAILGNDDAREIEPALERLADEQLLVHAHGCKSVLGSFAVYGYAFVPPTPFPLKDWERYDVSRHVDPGCVSPEEGRHSVAVSPNDLRYATIHRDLEQLAGRDPLDRAVFLFHAPPYRTKLDRAALDDRRVDHVPVEVHVGSVALRRFIEQRQPWITLHGHVHESARLTGAWADRLGSTHMFSAAHDGPELALVRLDLERPAEARRELL